MKRRYHSSPVKSKKRVRTEQEGEALGAGVKNMRNDIAAWRVAINNI
jgi:hypothetical protein